MNISVPMLVTLLPMVTLASPIQFLDLQLAVYQYVLIKTIEKW